MPMFKKLGAMLDVSRNGVMRVASVKQYIDFLQRLGFNTLLLYMEDVYPLPDYPMFGYMRGGYSLEELREIDAYAAEKGLEVVPCIQTLGHMEQYLQHAESAPVRSTAKELLCGEEATYRLIEAMVCTMRSCFRTDRIHVGMDECEGMSGGEYRRRHGEVDPFLVFVDHLRRVCGICESYSFRPIIWGDMLDGLKSAIPQEEKEVIVRGLPAFDFVDWKYWSINRESLLKGFEKDRRWGRHVMFAAGDSTWTGHLPNYHTVHRALLMSAQAAVESGIDEFFVTSWGDDGRECSSFFGLGAMLQIAAYNRTGERSSKEQLSCLAEEVGCMDYDTMLLGELFNRPMDDTFSEGKRILWSDLLMNSSRTFKAEIADVFRRTAQKVQPLIDRNDGWQTAYRFEKQAFETAAAKCEMLVRLRKAYIDGDSAYLQDAVTRLLPELYDSYEALERIHRTLWLKDYKGIGWQVLSARYGAQLMRVRYAIDRLRDYLAGEITEIEELIPTPFPYTDKPVAEDELDEFYVERMVGSAMLINMSTVH